MSNINEKVLSVITVTFNAEKDVKETLCALKEQENVEWGKIEIIFIDGASKDNTVSVINENKLSLEKNKVTVRVVSEPDKGIYDAMNKGVCLATGKWVYMLNAGDLLYNENTLSRIWEKLEKSDAIVLYGDYCRKNEYTEDHVKIKPVGNVVNEMIFCHQAVFVKTEYAKEHLFKLKYKLTADYDFLLNAYINGAKFEYVEEYIARYDLTGLSAVRMLEAYKEIHKVQKDCEKVKLNLKANIKFLIGLLKRYILLAMPQKLRWKLFNATKKEK
ncbi:MAG: glycosyltransferase [Clostridia bacterium]|nr:glycosyltransferase [Clostridia bacterium]